MISLKFYMTSTQTAELFRRCSLGKRREFDSIASFPDDVGEKLAMQGEVSVELNQVGSEKTGRCKLKLSDVTIDGVEYTSGDDFSLRRAQNQIALNQVVARRSVRAATEQERSRYALLHDILHASKNMSDTRAATAKAHDSADGGTYDFHGRGDGNRFPGKTRNYTRTPCIIPGDTIRWTEAVFRKGGSPRKLIGEREIVAHITSEGFDDMGNQRTYTFITETSDGREAFTCNEQFTRGACVLPLNNIERRVWSDESVRKDMLEAWFYRERFSALEFARFNSGD